jgi:hypothetical protein
MRTEALIEPERLNRTLAQARTVGEAIEVANKAAAIQDYYRKQQASLETVNAFAECRLLARR